MMRKPRSIRSFENLGRVRLSESFFTPDFLHSGIADFYGIPNLPDEPELAIWGGSPALPGAARAASTTFGRLDPVRLPFADG